MQFDGVALAVLAIIVVMAVIALGAIIVGLFRLISPWFESSKKSRQTAADEVENWFFRLRYAFRHKKGRTGRRAWDEDKDEDDDDEDDNDNEDRDDEDLDSSSIRILSTINSATIVVDKEDEIVRASPAVYELGLASNDSISNQQVLDAVHRSRISGEKESFDLVTMTPSNMAVSEAASDQGAPGHDDSNSVSSQQNDEDREMQLVSRRNWLTITVRAISDSLVLVLVQDNSEQRRFAQLRDDFVTNISRQLLIPTQALSQLGHDLEESLKAGNVTRQTLLSDSQTVALETRHLNHLVADLILLMKAQQTIKPSERNRLRVMDLVRNVGAACKNLAQNRNIKVLIQGDESLEINADRDQVEAAITKLVENAILYSPLNSTVVLSASRAKNKDLALIRVIDHGKGISREDQKRIFERFYRGSNQAEETSDGVGLGLAIAKHVALTHHGSIGVWSMPGQGSTFSFYLPLATA